MRRGNGIGCSGAADTRFTRLPPQGDLSFAVVFAATEDRCTHAQRVHFALADIVEISLAWNAFESLVLYESVRSQGYQVEFVSNEAETGVADFPSYLLVHARDVEAVRAIIG